MNLLKCLKGPPKEAVISVLFAWFIISIAFTLGLMGVKSGAFTQPLQQFYAACLFSFLALINIILGWVYLVWPVLHFKDKLPFLFLPWRSLLYGSFLGALAGILSPYALLFIGLFALEPNTKYLSLIELLFFFLTIYGGIGALIGGLSIFIYTRTVYEKQNLFSPTILYVSLALILLGGISGLFITF